MHRGGGCTGGGDAQGGEGGCTCILCIPPGYAPETDCPHPHPMECSIKAVEFLSIHFSKEILPRPKYAVCWLDNDEQQQPEDDSSHPAPVPPNHKSTGRPPPLLAPLVSCDRLTPPSHFQDVRLVALDLGGAATRPGDVAARPGELAHRPGDVAARPSELAARPGDVAARPGELAYRPGDVAVVQPGNLAEHVTTFFDLFPALDPARRFHLRQLDPNIPLPPRSEPRSKAALWNRNRNRRNLNFLTSGTGTITC
jgi:hypothetical protein